MEEKQGFEQAASLAVKAGGEIAALSSQSSALTAARSPLSIARGFAWLASLGTRRSLTAHILWGLFTPCLLLWPLTMRGIELATGPLAIELWMGRGIRSAMNAVLAQGEFPLWDPWLEGGSVAQIFGTLPFNIFTPLELLTGPGIKTGVIVLEIYLIYAFLSVIFQCVFRRLDVPPWIAGIATLLMLLVDPVWVSSQVPWWMGTITMVYPVVLLGLCLYLYDKRPAYRFRALALALAASLLLFFGAKTEVVYMFSVYMGALLLCHEAIRRWVQGVRRPPLRVLAHGIRDVFLFGGVPVLIFLWQLPLVLSLLRTASDRLTQQGWRLGETAEYFLFSLIYSRPLYAIAFLLAVFAIPKILGFLYRSLRSFVEWSARSLTQDPIRSVGKAASIAMLTAFAITGLVRHHGVWIGFGYIAVVLLAALAVPDIPQRLYSLALALDERARQLAGGHASKATKLWSAVLLLLAATLAIKWHRHLWLVMGVVAILSLAALAVPGLSYSSLRSLALRTAGAGAQARLRDRVKQCYVAIMILGVIVAAYDFNQPIYTVVYLRHEAMWMALGFGTAFLLWYRGGGLFPEKTGPDDRMSGPNLARWCLFLGSMYAFFLEGQLLTRNNPMPVPMLAALIFLMTLGMFGRTRLPGTRAISVLTSRRLRDIVLAAMTAGWLLRDVLAVPLYSLANLLYVNPRDYYWIITTTALLTAGGLMQLAAATANAFPVGILSPTKGWRPPPLPRLLWPILTTAFVLGVMVFSSTRFYLHKGEVSDNLVWKRYSSGELQALEATHAEYVSAAKAVMESAGGFARVLTPENFYVGVPGVDIDQGIYEAWGYGYLGSFYRDVAERAFAAEPYHTNPVPRALYYSSSGQRIITQKTFPRFFTKQFAIGEANRFYTNDNIMASGATIDPFYMELLRVGLIWDVNLQGPPRMLPNDRLERLPTAYMPAYRFKPERGLQRLGILPADDPAAAWIGSEQDGEMRKLYAALKLTDGEQAEAGITAFAASWGVNRDSFKVSTKAPFWLVLFDSWHPDWQVSINGQKADITRTFINFRAVKVPAGDSEVIFDFQPPFLRLTLAGSLATVFMVLAGLWLGYRRHHRTDRSRNSRYR